MRATDRLDLCDIFLDIVFCELVYFVGDYHDIFLLLHEVLEHVFVVTSHADFGIDDEYDDVLLDTFVAEVPEDTVAQ